MTSKFSKTQAEPRAADSKGISLLPREMFVYLSFTMALTVLIVFLRPFPVTVTGERHKKNCFIITSFSWCIF